MMRLGDCCGKYLCELAESDSRIQVLDGDLADSDGAIHFANRYPERFIMAGIAEQSMVSIAAGMATCGLRPFVFSFASFLVYRAYDQIRVCVSQSRQPVTLVGSHSGGLTNRNGKTHAALNDIALMATLPFMQVWSPADPGDLYYTIDQIMVSDQPAYIRLPRKPLPGITGKPGSIRVIRTPKPMTIISTGLGTQLAIEVCEILTSKGVDIGLVHCLLLAPFPSQEIINVTNGTEIAFIIEDHLNYGGLSSLIQALQLKATIVPVGWPANWPGQSGSDESILTAHAMSPELISYQIMNEL